MADSAPYRQVGALAFRPASPIADGPLLTAFGRDLYVESLGGAAQFQHDFGRAGQKFPLWIASCAAS
ncbi:MAG: hypothetical protein ACX939_15300, partial [Hyphococcus sp.]